MKYLSALAGIGLTIAGSFLPSAIAMVAIGFFAAVLGALFARAQQGSTFQVVESPNANPIELGTIIDRLDANNLMPLYVRESTGGIRPITSAYIARLNSQRAIVLEAN